jgi:hypothetical protein
MNTKTLRTLLTGVTTSSLLLLSLLQNAQAQNNQELSLKSTYDCQQQSYRHAQLTPQFKLGKLADFSDNSVLISKMGNIKIDDHQVYVRQERSRSQIHNLQDLYNTEQPRNPGTTLGQHTQDVLEQFDSLWPKFVVRLSGKPFNKSEGEISELKNLLRLAISLHDIGKTVDPLRQKQHEFTIPIVCYVAQHYDLTPAQIRLMTALIGNDIFGYYVRSEDRPSDIERNTLDALQELADYSGVSLKEYFELQKLFYTADASSYANVRQSAFVDDANDGLHIRDRADMHFKDLLNELNARRDRWTINGNQSFNSLIAPAAGTK